MRHLQFRRVDRLVAVEQNIHIDQPRPFGHQLLAAHARFDGAQRLQQLQRRKIRVRLHDAIQKPRLLSQIDGLGFVNRGGFSHLYSGIGKRCDRILQIFGAIAHVRPQRKIHGLAHTMRRGRSGLRCMVRSYTDAPQASETSSGREPGCASKNVATSPILTRSSLPISTMQWLAETAAITGYSSPLMRTLAPFGAVRGQPSAWPTGRVATQTSSLATYARL